MISRMLIRVTTKETISQLRAGKRHLMKATMISRMLIRAMLIRVTTKETISQLRAGKRHLMKATMISRMLIRAMLIRVTTKETISQLRVGKSHLMIRPTKATIKVVSLMIGPIKATIKVVGVTIKVLARALQITTSKVSRAMTRVCERKIPDLMRTELMLRGSRTQMRERTRMVKVRPSKRTTKAHTKMGRRMTERTRKVKVKRSRLTTTTHTRMGKARMSKLMMRALTTMESRAPTTKVENITMA